MILNFIALAEAIYVTFASMPLNTHTLFTRSLSAAVFVILLIGSVVWNYYSYAAFFFIVSVIALHEFYQMMKKNGNQPYSILGHAFGIGVFISLFNFPIGQTEPFIQPDPLFFKIIVSLFPFLLLGIAMLDKRENSIKNAMITTGGVIYTVLPFALLNQVCSKSEGGLHSFYPWMILGTIFLIWCNDTFAYLGGSVFGKNKMIERVSPGKTWEGTAIGILTGIALGFCFDTFFFPMKNHLWVVLGFTVPILATFGDLVESKLKRECGVKDSGNIMPGHGGALDRFDSLIFVSPFLYTIVMILQH